MTIRLFLVERIDYSAVKPLASLIYSNVMLRRLVTRVEIREKTVEFIRPPFLNSATIPLALDGLECRNGVIYGPSREASDSIPSSSQYAAIVDALRHFSEGGVTEYEVG